MHKQITFVLLAAILLAALASVAIYTMKAVNAQGNATSAGGANMTKGNITNATSGGAKNMTGAAAAKIANATKTMGASAGGGKRPG
jgi:hypothetical protein